MKRIINLVAFFLLSSFSSQALDASISFATFKSPQQNYVFSNRGIHSAGCPNHLI